MKQCKMLMKLGPGEKLVNQGVVAPIGELYWVIRITPDPRAFGSGVGGTQPHSIRKIASVWRLK